MRNVTLNVLLVLSLLSTTSAYAFCRFNEYTIQLNNNTSNTVAVEVVDSYLGRRISHDPIVKVITPRASGTLCISKADINNKPYSSVNLIVFKNAINDHSSLACMLSSDTLTNNRVFQLQITDPCFVSF